MLTWAQNWVLIANLKILMVNPQISLCSSLLIPQIRKFSRDLCPIIVSFFSKVLKYCQKIGSRNLNICRRSANSTILLNYQVSGFAIVDSNTGNQRKYNFPAPKYSMKMLWFKDRTLEKKYFIFGWLVDFQFADLMNQKVCGFEIFADFTYKKCGFVICGLAHPWYFQICDRGMSLRICRLIISGLLHKICIWRWRIWWLRIT